MKTIQFVAAGVTAAGNNASVTPGLPSGTSIGDVVFIQASIRNAGTGIPDTPSGWKCLVLNDNLALFAKVIAVTADLTMPTITFSAGAANATTLAQAFAIRQCSTDLDTLVHAVEVASNASAQDIDTPALTVTLDGCLLLHLGWKQLNWTSVAVPSGDTEFGSNNSALGSTAAQVISGVVQTAAASASADSFVVTGGASAISRSATMALAPYITTWTDIASSDAPCDFTTEFNLVSNAACTALQAISDEITYLENRPASRASATQGASSVENIVPYSSVDFDPSGIIDLESDPYSITANRVGMWISVHNTDIGYGLNGNQVNSSLADNSARGNSSVDMDSTRNPPLGGGVHGLTTFSESYEDFAARMATEIGATGFSVPSPLTVQAASISAIWMSE